MIDDMTCPISRIKLKLEKVKFGRKHISLDKLKAQWCKEIPNFFYIK